MIDFLIINKVLVALVSIISVWLGLWVYSADRKKKVNQIFLVLVLSTSLWVILYYLVMISNQALIANFLAKLGYGIVSLFYIPFYLFFIYFLRLEKKFCNLTKIVVIAAIIIFTLSIFTDSIVEKIEFTEWGANIVVSGGAIIFYLMGISLSALVIGLLLKTYFQFSKQEKLKIQYFLIGVLVWVLMNFIFNMVLYFMYFIP